MALIITGYGMNILLDHLASNETPGWNDFEVRLFQQPHVPNVNELIGDYLPIECNFDDYAPIVLTPIGQAAYASTTSSLDFEPCDWEVETNVVQNYVYGWFLCDTNTHQLIAASDDPDAPREMLEVGDFYNVTLRFRLSRA